MPANREGICFANVIDTCLHYEEEMDAASDLIVLYSHSGIDTDIESDFIRRLIGQTDTIGQNPSERFGGPQPSE